MLAATCGINRNIFDQLNNACLKTESHKQFQMFKVTLNNNDCMLFFVAGGVLMKYILGIELMYEDMRMLRHGLPSTC